MEIERLKRDKRDCECKKARQCEIEGLKRDCECKGRETMGD
jgi:hypothetical protein